MRTRIFKLKINFLAQKFKQFENGSEKAIYNFCLRLYVHTHFAVQAKMYSERESERANSEKTTKREQGKSLDAFFPSILSRVLLKKRRERQSRKLIFHLLDLYLYCFCYEFGSHTDQMIVVITDIRNRIKSSCLLPL